VDTTLINYALIGPDGDVPDLSVLIDVSYASFRRLSQQMLRGFEGVRPLHETDDVWHDASIRLISALRETTPESKLHFYRLAGLQIRRTLIDLARKSRRQVAIRRGFDVDQFSDDADDRESCSAAPGDLTEWEEFHEQVQLLPDADRTVVDLLWYGGVNQTDAARMLGLDVRTVQRRWRSARMKLADVCLQQPDWS
jgi:RNA polymerase sigma factor (sigma-70 family)